MAAVGVGTYVALAATVASTAVTAYQAHVAPGPSKPQLPDENIAKKADTTSLASQMGNAEKQAETAGGTILSNPAARAAIGSDTLSPRKSLLGG